MEGDRVAVEEDTQGQRRPRLAGSDKLDDRIRGGTGDTPALAGDQGPQQDVGDAGLAGQYLAELGRCQGQDPAPGCSPVR